MLLFSACHHERQEQVDKLNEKSYAYHYRSLDSTQFYAREALRLSNGYQAGQAEALNNLAFVSIAKMDYDLANKLLDSIKTNNVIELLIADVQHMRLCQRESKNKLFYDYREQAQRRLKRIEEELERLTPHQYSRFVYAKSEYAIVQSVYFYYVGLLSQSASAIDAINPHNEIENDTAQLLNYLYNIGSGGIIKANTREEVSEIEFDYLVRCYQLSVDGGYVFYEAQALQGMSEHLQDVDFRNRFVHENIPALALINPDEMADSLLAGYLAQRALNLFEKYGDIYQTAGAYRTLAECFWGIRDYQSAEICLLNALNKDTVINRAPDLVASIREQLSLAYSATDKKELSDINRNVYLDMQEKTRQDKQLEARADQLKQSSRQLNIMITAVVVMILLVLLMLVIFHQMRLRNDRRFSVSSLLQPLEEWKQAELERYTAMNERDEELREQINLSRLQILNNKKKNLEQRAKVSLVNSIMPFIDRVINEIRKLLLHKDNPQVRLERYVYISELTDKINEYNEILTHWIQMRRGEVSLRIESFPIQSLFDIVKRGRMSFQMKGIDLVVEDSNDVVKADKTLTLFMINTIADNARKFTNKGGRVKVSSRSFDNYVEIAIEDTGVGMSEEQLSTVFNHQPTTNNHGFGLMNCKGIIDKYHKVSKIFSVCTITAESNLGKGTRFAFRLPKGLLKGILWIVSLTISAQNCYADFLDRASSFADSAYYSNLNGTYNQTLVFADSCRYYLNNYYHQLVPNEQSYMVEQTESTSTPAELQWFKDSLPMNFNVILDIRNEMAVAALALHNWSLYSYNNKVYTQLFREISADNTLDQYCRVMQKSGTNKNIAIIILVLLLITIFPAYYLLYYRYRLAYRYNLERVNRINEILLSNASATEKLDRIEQLWKKRSGINHDGASDGELNHVVTQIFDALQKSINIEKSQQTTIEFSEDELRRVQYENDRLHISNNVLDNCLSTLKHETMYYPSRIQQLLPSVERGVSKELIDGHLDDNLQAIAELADYYKELFAMLSAQTMRQCELPVQPDREIINYLFEILGRQGGGAPQVIDEDLKEGYVKIAVPMQNIRLTAQQCSDLFTPLTIHVDFLLCKQIIRDLGEATNARGCGIEAKMEQTNESDFPIVNVIIIITKKIWSLLK